MLLNHNYFIINATTCKIKRTNFSIKLQYSVNISDFGESTPKILILVILNDIIL